MNYNGKSIANIENDDLNIKSHLNASLDFNGISVSEDLINRTLEAIKKHTAEQQDDKKDSRAAEEFSKRVIPWNRYIRGLAGVAAAALIIVAGYGLLNSAGSKKSDTNSLTAQDRTMMDAATDDSTQEYAANSAVAETPADNGAAAEGTGGAAGAASDENSDAALNSTETAPSVAEQFTVTMDSDVSAQGAGTDGSRGIAAEDGNTMQSDASAKSSESLQVLTFRDVFLADPAQVQSLTITDEADDTSVTITNQDEILEFYSVMDKYQFTYNTEASSANSYTVEITAPQQNGAVYTMTVGSSITISFTDKEAASQSVYSVTDNALLIQDITDFFHKYNE